MDSISGFKPVFATSKDSWQWQKLRFSGVEHARQTEDSVDISDKAKTKQAELAEKSRTKDKEQSFWTKRYGLEEGSTMFSDGREQVVEIDENDVVVHKYLGSRLLSTTTGMKDSHGVQTKTEFYDEEGSVIQTMENISRKGTPYLEQNVRWFTNGEMTREMQSQLKTGSQYIFADTQKSDSFKALVKEADSKVHSVLNTTIKEYHGDRLIRTAHINQDELPPRHLAGPEEDDPELNTRAITGHVSKYNYSVSISTYDLDGNLLRQAAFSDGFDLTTKYKEQAYSVAWYGRDGELTKTSTGSLSMGKPVGGQDPFSQEEQPAGTEKEKTEPFDPWAIVDEDKEYKGPIKNRFSATDGWSALQSKKNLGDPDTYIGRTNPYEISVSESYYNDGELVARQEDMQGAEKPFLIKEPSFKPGKGLTEDEIPLLVEKSSHVDESYDENGLLKRRAELSNRESLRPDEEDVYHVETIQTAHMKTEDKLQKAHQTLDDRLEDIDAHFNDALETWKQEADLTVGDAMDMLDTALRKMGFQDDSKRE